MLIIYVSISYVSWIYEVKRDIFGASVPLSMESIQSKGASVDEWLWRLPLKLLAPLRWGSNPMRGSCQLLREDCWFTIRNNLFLHMWKLTAIYNQT